MAKIQELYSKLLTSKVRLLTLCFLFLFPTLALAEGENPFSKLKSKLKFNWKVIENFDFGFMIFMIVISLLIIVVICYLIYLIITHVIKSLNGKAEIGDKKFWIKVGVSFFILFLLIGGTLISLLENAYTWVDHLDIDGSVD